ncbi:MAG: D-alanine--D-alanine ligase [Candidatus Omnitrophota bacterium]
MGLIPDSLTVGVLAGGVSGEREISLISGQEAYNALRRNNVRSVFIDIVTCEPEKVKELLSASNIDVAFIALHGEFGEDGRIQKILDEVSITYTGSGQAASYLAMNKIFSKKMFIKCKVPTPGFLVYEEGKGIPYGITYPVVVKPYFAGSSLGVSVVTDAGSLPAALGKACAFQNKVVIEEYIEGREFTVGILEEKPLAVVEIIPKKGYFDFTTKYSDGLAEFVVPAQLDDVLYQCIQEEALRAHQALGCKHFSRVDIRLRTDNAVYVLEVNSIPGLTTHSLLPLSARCCGISFDELVARMVWLALNEKKQFQEVRKS